MTRTDRDAIKGARYRDSVFNDEFVIIDIEPDTFDSHEPEDITLTLEYDQMGTVEIDLAQFRDEYGIDLIDVPSEQ